MLSSFTLQCPTKNANSTWLPFLTTAKSVMCKTCSALTTDGDNNPEKGHFFTHVNFGRLMKTQSSGRSIIDEKMIDGYKVFAIDSTYRKIAELFHTGVIAGTETCCHSNRYALTVSGIWPTGATHLMVVPTHGMYSLATGQVVAFTDSSSGAATAFKGSLGITVSNPKTFVSNPNSKVIMQKTIADATEGVTHKQVSITSLTVSTSRRLGANSRQLGGHMGGISVEYVILKPAGQTFAKESIQTDKLKTALVAQTKAVSGKTIEVSAATVNAVTSTPIAGTVTETSGANAVASVLIAAVAVVAGHAFR